MVLRGFILILVLMVWSPQVGAQENQSKTAGRRPQLIEPGWAGTGRYRANAWGLVRTGVRNVTQKQVDLHAKVWFNDQGAIQFTAPVWAPGMSRLRTDLPVRLPNRADKSRQVDMSGQLVRRTGNAENSQTPFSEGTGGFILQDDYWINCLIRDSSDEVVVRMIEVMRESRRLNKQFTMLHPRNAPRTKLGYDAIDCVVMSKDRPQLESMQMSAIRQWVIGGGTIWIMLDQVDPTFAQKLLHDNWNLHLVDQVALTQFTLTDSGSSVDRRFDRPVTLTKVVAPDMHVIHRVNGWPASLAAPVGQGWLVVTTLGPRGWMNEQREAGHPSWVAGQWRASEPLQQWGGKLIQRRRYPATITRRHSSFEPLIDAEIGHEILSRGVVLILLSGFCVGLIVIGFVLAKKGRLEQMMWAGPGLAAAVAVALIGLSESKGRAVPLTVAVGQHIQVAPGGREAVVAGLAGIYSPQGGRGRLASHSEGHGWPRIEGRGGRLRELLWSDLGHWQWRQRLEAGIDIPARNLRHVEFEVPIALDQRAGAVLQLDANGISVVVQAGQFKKLEDQILVGPNGAMNLRNAGERKFRAGPGEVLMGPSRISTDLFQEDFVRRSGQYVSAGALSDVQQSRQTVYRRLLDPPDVSMEPAIIGWTSPLNLNLQWPEKAQKRGQALVSIPVQIRRPPAGTAVTIPSPLVRFEPIQLQPQFDIGAFHFQPERWGWVPVGQNGTVVMQFVPPRTLRPLRLESVTLGLTMEAAGRTVKLEYRTPQSEKILIDQLSAPSGTHSLSFDLEQPVVLDRDGLIIELTVESPVGDAPTSLWRVDRIQMQMNGTVLKSDRAGNK